MVQADATRNYYLDLGVPANAEENDIRKAFRQLALKYHPDRNPGRESEFVQKFQQIQAAHEILSDPTQRAKYDQERRKYSGLNIPPYNPSTPRTRPPPPSRPSYAYKTTPSGSYYRAPPPKATPQPPPQRPPPPQHHHSTYVNGADRFTSRNFRAPPTAQQPHSRAKEAEARANVFTAWQKMKQPRAEEPRPQYPNPNPNMNNPNGTPFGRSKSTRMPSKKGFDPLTPGGDEGQARSSYRSNYERPMQSPPHADPLKHFKEQMEEEEVPYVPYAEGNRERTPYFSTAGERTSMFSENVGRSSSVRNSPTHRPSSSADAGSYSDSGGRRGQRGQRNSYHGSGSNPLQYMYVSSSDDDSPPPKAPPPQQASFRTSPANGPDAAPSTFKSRSEESINMKFSPSHWHGKFEGKPDYFAPSNAQKGASAKDRTSPVRGRPSQRTAAQRGQFSGQSQPPPSVSPFNMPPSSQMPPPPPPPPPPPGPPPLNTQPNFPTGTASAPQTAKFNQEAWADTFKEPSFILPQSAKETSPRRGSVTSKRSKPGRKPSTAPTGTNTSSDTPSESSRPKYQAFTEDATNGDGDAMDIDSGTPPAEKPKPSAAARDKTYKQGTPIKFSTPSKTAPSSPQDQKSTPTVANGSATALSSATEARHSSGLGGLEGLKNVEPFLPSTNSGLSGMGDLGDSLPFKSKASNAHPTKPNSAQRLRYPPVPNAPQPPATLDEASVRTYFIRMEHYVKSFREYNKTMTNHFMSREAELETSLEDHFIQNRGETTKKLGFSSYVRKMKEDQAVMEAWKIAQEMHLRAMQACEEVRNKTIRSHVEG